jgi:hypothetical protein
VQTCASYSLRHIPVHDKISISAPALVVKHDDHHLDELKSYVCQIESAPFNFNPNTDHRIHHRKRKHTIDPKSADEYCVYQMLLTY